MKKAQKNIFVKYEKKWVATTPDYSRVLAVDISVKDLNKKLLKLGEVDSVITYVNPFAGYYSP